MSADAERLLRELGIEIEDKVGSELWSRCPFPGHAETKASWSINSENLLHRCFGCGAGGGPVMLVAEVIGITNGGAFGWLREHGFLDAARPYGGAEIEFSTHVSNGQLEQPFGVVLRPLDEWVTPARRYLESPDRRVNSWQVGRWRLGYAVSGPLAGRIYLPLQSALGSLLSYHARDFTGAELESDGRPRKRYLYPRSADGMDKDAIFGECHWSAKTSVVVTEGAFDALACERAGAPAVAALGNSHPSPTQLGKLSRFARVVVCTDNDRAGNEAAFAIYSELCRHVKSVTRIDLPLGVDAAQLQHEELARQLRIALAEP